MRFMSEQEFDRDVAAARCAANAGPVVIADRDGPAYVLMSIADYRGLKRPHSSLSTVLAADHEFELDLPERTVSARDRR